MAEQFFQTLFLLIAGHALADFALQTEFVSTFKSPEKWLTLPEESSIRFPSLWIYVMMSHALQHGAIVFLVTRSLTAGLLEVAVHFATDYAKCRHWINFHMDQLLHVSVKVVWAFMAYPGLLTLG